ncbi:hypothetical protein A3709_20015 [Halioglobus sp. HI00S01]|nr:hypothetical protein A3709_20015 [Halioglobus sp. HI00S01]
MLFRAEEKKINSARAKRLCQSECARIARERGVQTSDLTKDERKQVENKIKEDMLKRAEPSEKHLAIAFDRGAGLMFFNAPQNSFVERFTAELRKIFPDIALSPLVSTDLSPFLTTWLNAPSSMPRGSVIGGEAAMEYEDSKATMSATDLTAADVQTFVANHRTVTRLSIVLVGAAEFVLTKAAEVRRLSILNEEDTGSADGDSGGVPEDRATMLAGEMFLNAKLLKQIFDWIHEQCVLEDGEGDFLGDGTYLLSDGAGK